MTWKNIFDIIKSMWDVNHNQIAEFLKVNRSTISNLNNGKHLRSREITPQRLYDNIFNPNNPNSLAYSQEPHSTKEGFAKHLTEVLAELNLYDKSTPINENNYEQFIKKMAKTDKINCSQTTSTFQNIVNTALEVKNQNQQNNVTPLEEMSNAFYQSCKGFGIEDFIEQDPYKSFRPYQLEDALSFYNHIIAIQKQNDGSDMDSGLYQNICCFTNTLFEYILILYRNSDRTKVFPEDFTSITSKEQLPEIDDLREKLKSLYCTIQASIEADLNKYRTERKLENRKAWEECIHKGIFFHIEE